MADTQTRAQRAESNAFPAWEAPLLNKIGAPVNTITLVGMNLWAKSEGVAASANNWLAIEGADTGLADGDYNSEGVSTFPSLSAGVNATADFLQNGYPGIVSAFQNGTSLKAIYAAINASDWCKGCSGGRYPSALADEVNADPSTIPVYRDGPSGNYTETGTSSSGFFQCNSNDTLIGTPGIIGSIGKISLLNACQAKAIVGGLITGVGGILLLVGVGMIVASPAIKQIEEVLGVAMVAKKLPGKAKSLVTSAGTPTAKPDADDIQYQQWKSSGGYTKAQRQWVRDRDEPFTTTSERRSSVKEKHDRQRKAGVA